MKRVLLLCSLALAGCASEALEMSTVIPRPEAHYTVASSWKQHKQALQWALEASKLTCAERKMQYVVLDEQDSYKGLLNEQTAEKINQARGIAQSIGLPLLAPSLHGDYGVQLEVQCVAAD